MTKDHKVTDEAEIKRIEGRGGMIFGGKVGGTKNRILIINY